LTCENTATRGEERESFGSKNKKGSRAAAAGAWSS